MIVPENEYKSLQEIESEIESEIKDELIIYSSIFNQETLYILLKKIKDLSKDDLYFVSDNKNILYKNNIPSNTFPNFIDHIRRDIEKITDFHFNSCLIDKNWSNTNTHNKEITPILIIGNDIRIKSKDKILNIKNGSLIIERENVEKNIIKKNNFYTLTFLNIRLPDNNIKVKKKITGALKNSLSEIYLSYKQRILLKEKIKNSLSSIHNISEEDQCYNLNKLKKYLNIGKLIGSGDWGNVYTSSLNDLNEDYKFAIKMSRITEKDLIDPYSDSSSVWYEFWILKDIIKPLIEKQICPNLPLYIDTFLCNKCNFTIRDKKQQHPCIITVAELATYDLKAFLMSDTNIEDKIIYSALFQIMAGLHAIQMSGQILNNDIKSTNILVYNVKPGGYWKYKIQNNNYYVPNYGKMFILNDFGVSHLYDPNFQLYSSKNKTVFNLGSRYAININDTFSPINAKYEFINNNLIKTSDITWKNTNNSFTSKGSNYTLDRKTGQVVISKTRLTDIQKEYLFENGVNVNPNTWEFFENPYIIPPFEFYNDVQDVLRMFVGGKRTTQNGNHRIFTSISSECKDNIRPYLGKSENSKSKVFSLEVFHVLAGSFIKNFFGDYTNVNNYITKPDKKIKKLIEFYNMDKNTKYE